MKAIRTALLAAAATLAMAGAAQAATRPDCGVTGSNTVSIGDYNPFAPALYTNVPVNLTLTRAAYGSAKTQTVNFILTQPPGSPPYQITYNGSNVLYTTPVPVGSQPVINSQASGQIYYNFGGASQPDTTTIPLVVTIPPGVDLSAGDPIRFDILFVCNGTGQMNDVTSPKTLPDAITLNINVLSALQAHYAGPALDFGEIGDYPANLSGVPASARERTGYFGVRSSGPYEIRLTSENDYRMTYPGGNPNTASQSVEYEVEFMSQTVHTDSWFDFWPIRCKRAGVSPGASLPIKVALREGGDGKTPSPNYRDILSVTFTPLAVPVSSWPPVYTCS